MDRNKLTAINTYLVLSSLTISDRQVKFWPWGTEEFGEDGQLSDSTWKIGSCVCGRPSREFKWDERTYFRAPGRLHIELSWRSVRSRLDEDVISKPTKSHLTSNKTGISSYIVQKHRSPVRGSSLASEDESKGDVVKEAKKTRVCAHICSHAESPIHRRTADLSVNCLGPFKVPNP
jgi:hypothetical protein